MNQQSPRSAKGWTVVIAGLAINLILGVLYAWSVMGKALAKDWHWTKSQATLPMSVATACFAFMMVFAGRWQDRFGPRRVAIAGGLLLGLGILASAFASTSEIMALTFGVGAGLGIGLGYSATTPPAIKWFPPARKGFITGIVVSGVGLAAAYMAPLTQYLLNTLHIHNTFAVLGGFVIVVVPLLALLLQNPPETASSPAGVASSSKAPSSGEAGWQAMCGKPQFYLLWFQMLLSVFAGLMITSQIASIAKEQAHWDSGFVAVALLAIFNTLGRLLSGFVSDAIGRPATMAIAFFVQAANMLAFSHYDTETKLLAGTAVAGLCYGTGFSVLPATTADYFGLRNLGVNYGLVFTAFGVGGVLGPMLSAKISDQTHSYSIAYEISAVMLVLGAFVALLTRPPRSRAETDGKAASIPQTTPIPKTT